MSDFVIHYDFKSNSINNNQLYNSAIDQYDATFQSVSSYSTPVGKTGPYTNVSSINFISSDQQCVVINPKTTLGSGLSLCFWINLTPSSNTKYSLINFSNGTSGQYISMDANYNSTNGNLSINLSISGTTNGSNNVYQQNVNLGDANNWYHLTWTISNSNIWKFYKNGILVNTFQNMQYPVQVYRDFMYIGKQYGNNPQYFSGYIGDFRMYNSALNQDSITNIYTNYSNSPKAPDILERGFDQMYNQIFCNFVPTTSNNFKTCNNCNYGDSMNINKQSKVSGGQSECELNCKNNNLCTSYSYDLNSGNCKQYSNFPYQVNTGVNGINSGYSLNYSYDFNKLSQSQQDNIKNKCALQYTNKLYSPDKQIDLNKCLNVENAYNSTTYLKYDPECVFKKYTENGIPLKSSASSSKASYSSSNDYGQPVSDPILDKYQTKYGTYIQDKVQLSNINNLMSIQDPNYDSNYLNKVKEQNNILGNKYLNSINIEMKPLIGLTEKITDKIHMLKVTEEMKEGFENNVSDIGNNFLKLLIFMVIISIIFTIIFNICK